MKPHVNDSAMIPKVILLVIGFFILGANSFAPRAIKSHVRPLTRTEGRSTQPISALHAAPDNVPALFQGVYDPVYSYVNFWVENLPWSIAPDFLLHWGHPAAMGTVLIVMGGIGTYAGYEIRKGNGARDDYFFTLDGKTVRDSHPLIMGLASFFFLLGGQGGLVLLLDQGKPILESPHALTAVAGLGLLALQALLPLTFEKGGQAARTAHTVLGTSTMAVLGGHMLTGLNLGTSF